MKSNADDDLDRELAAVYAPVERDPHNVAALRALVEVLHVQFDPNSDEGDGIGAVWEKLAQGRDVSKFEHEFIIYVARLALRLPERLLT